MSLRFPRFHYGFVSADKNKSWIAVVHFTRIPHIRFVYSNRREKHALPALLQRELGQQLIESETVDLFIRNSDRIFVGNTVGLYVYEKLQHLVGLRKLAEDSKYTPEGSDLKALLQNLSSIFSEERRTPKPVELPFRGRAVRNFLEKCDSRVAASLGGDKLEVLLQRVGISAKQWLTAGRRGLLDRLGLGTRQS